MHNVMLFIRRLVGVPILVVGVGIVVFAALIIRLGAWLASIAVPSSETPADFTDEELAEIIAELEEAQSNQDKD